MWYLHALLRTRLHCHAINGPIGNGDEVRQQGLARAVVYGEVALVRTHHHDQHLPAQGRHTLLGMQRYNFDICHMKCGSSAGRVT